MVWGLELKKLGFNSQTYSEVIVTVKHGGLVNSSPIGVLARRGTLYFKLYEGSRTYLIFSERPRDCVLNITSNPKLFYYAIFAKEKLKYTPGSRTLSPRIVGCEGYVECEVGNLDFRTDYLRVEVKPILLDFKTIHPKTFNRAEPALIEALVWLTKLRGVSDNLDYYKVLERIKYNVETIYKSSRRRDLRRLARSVLREAERIYEQRSVEDRRNC